jgi:hypothetical protein
MSYYAHHARLPPSAHHATPAAYTPRPHSTHVTRHALIVAYQDAIKVIDALLPVACHVQRPLIYTNLAAKSDVIVDFGQNMAGRLRVSLSLPSAEQCEQKSVNGTSHVTLRMLHSELLHANGSLNTITLGNFN